MLVWVVRWVLETFEDSKGCFVCIFSDIELVLFDSKFMFSSLTLPVAIGLILFGLEKSWHNQSHRGVVYLFKIQDGVNCKKKFLRNLD